MGICAMIAITSGKGRLSINFLAWRASAPIEVSHDPQASIEESSPFLSLVRVRRGWYPIYA